MGSKPIPSKRIYVLFELYFVHGHQSQGMGRTFRHASGFHARIDTIHAVVAFHRFIGFRIILRNPPWTSACAGHAADAFFLIDKDDAVFSLLHGAGGAYRHTEWIFAMITASELEFRLGNTSDRFQWFMAYLAKKRTNWQTLVRFAM